MNARNQAGNEDSGWKGKLLKHFKMVREGVD